MSWIVQGGLQGFTRWGSAETGLAPSRPEPVGEQGGGRFQLPPMSAEGWGDREWRPP